MIWPAIWPWVLAAVLRRQRVNWWISKNSCEKALARYDNVHGGTRSDSNCTCADCIEPLGAIYGRWAQIR